MKRRLSTRVLVLAGLVVALIIAGALSRFASSDPDGLTKVSEDHGFASSGTSHDGVLAYGGWSGVAGAVAVLVVIAAVVILLRRHRPPDED